MKALLRTGIILLLVIVLLFAIVTPININSESPRKVFLTETKIAAPEGTSVILDEKERFGDGFRKILFSSTPEINEIIINKAQELGYPFRKPDEYQSMVFMPNEMKKSAKKEELTEFYMYDGPKTVVVVLSSEHIFMWIGWI